MKADEAPEQYISKSALVAEIEKLEKLYCYGKSDGMLIAKSVFDSIKNIIDTLKVKEVDSLQSTFSASDRGIIDEIIFALKTIGEEKMISYDKEIEWLIKLKEL